MWGPRGGPPRWGRDGAPPAPPPCAPPLQRALAGVCGQIPRCGWGGRLAGDRGRALRGGTHHGPGRPLLARPCPQPPLGLSGPSVPVGAEAWLGERERCVRVSVSCVRPCLQASVVCACVSVCACPCRVCVYVLQRRVLRATSSVFVGPAVCQLRLHIGDAGVRDKGPRAACVSGANRVGKGLRRWVRGPGGGWLCPVGGPTASWVLGASPRPPKLASQAPGALQVLASPALWSAGS